MTDRSRQMATLRLGSDQLSRLTVLDEKTGKGVADANGNALFGGNQT